MHQTRSGKQRGEMFLATGFSQADFAISLSFGKTIPLLQVLGVSGQMPGCFISQL